MITSQNICDTEKVEVTNEDRLNEGIWCPHYMNPFYGTFYYSNGTEVAVYSGIFNFERTENDYTGPDPIFQTDKQFTHTVLLRDENSATPIKCVCTNVSLMIEH